MFIPSVAGRVLSRSEALQAGGGGVAIYFQGVDYGVDFQRRLLDQAPLVADMVRRAVNGSV